MAGNQVGDSIHMSKYFHFFLVAVLLGACDSSIEKSAVPNVPVNIEINLNDIDNVALKQIGGFIYVQGGVRGIIVRHESQNLYKAYERNCTFQPADASAIVEVHSSTFYIEDTSCSSTFDLNGFPTGGPAEFPLKEYGVSMAGDILFIFN
jgi:hypothetical protein